MSRKKICWITPNYFFDVDLPIVKALSNVYEIHWITLLAKIGTSDDEEFIRESVKGYDNLQVVYYHFKTRGRSPKHIFEAIDVIRLAKSFNPDIYYLSESFAPYGTLLYRAILPLDKCVIACHNVTTPKGARHARIAKWYTDKWLRTFNNIQTFSENQREQLLKNYQGKNVLTAHLALKDYGEPSIKVDKSELPFVRFLVFGNIVHYKRIDLLLQAVNILYDKGVRDFNVRIAGHCPTWNTEYAPLIKHPELFELKIERVPNNEVADLFADSHYFVMPYQDIAQSGAMTVAFRYNLPTIVSDIPQFKEFVKDGETGFVFKTQDAQSLADKMEWVIKNHKSIYPHVCEKQRQFVEENMSLKAITQKYITYFDKL